jgi:STE24 endopeptidase
MFTVRAERHDAMKNFVSLVLALFFALFVLTVFVPYPPARAQAERYFTAQEIDRGLNYSFERRLLFWGSSAVELGILLVLGLTGAARRLADLAVGVCHGYWLPAVLGVGGLCFGLIHALQFPFSLGRFYLARAWGMSSRDLGPWLAEYALSLGVEAAIGAVALVCFFLLLRFAPRLWWAIATLGGGLLAALIAFLLPVLIAPLFNTFTPLSKTTWADLESGIRRLTEKSGVPVQDILVMDASRQGQHTNAYFTGFGPTRRIVLYDTLLSKHSPGEIESILGHELGHWTHQHIVKGIVLGMCGTLVGLLLLDRILRRLQGRAPWHMSSLADPAGLPLILLLGYLGSWLVMPAENAVSRYFERQADTASLELAGMPQVFIRAEEKLARDNISNVAPTPWNVWLFSTHPTTIQRIEMADNWGQQRRDAVEP